MQKITLEISLPLPRNRLKHQSNFIQFMTSMTMFTHSENPSNFVRI